MGALFGKWSQLSSQSMFSNGRRCKNQKGTVPTRNKHFLEYTASIWLDVVMHRCTAFYFWLVLTPFHCLVESWHPPSRELGASLGGISICFQKKQIRNFNRNYFIWFNLFYVIFNLIYSIHPSIHPSIHAAMLPSIHQSIHPCFSASILPCFYASIHLCCDASIHPSIQPSMLLCFHPAMILCIHQFMLRCIHASLGNGFC